MFFQNKLQKRSTRKQILSVVDQKFDGLSVALRTKFNFISSLSVLEEAFEVKHKVSEGEKNSRQMIHHISHILLDSSDWEKHIQRYAESNKQKIFCLSERRGEKWTSHEHAKVDFLSVQLFSKLHVAIERSLCILKPLLSNFSSSLLYIFRRFNKLSVSLLYWR